eukprot:1158914-Pelagomonas_calceolata.AAC.1
MDAEGSSCRDDGMQRHPNTRAVRCKDTLLCSDSEMRDNLVRSHGCDARTCMRGCSLAQTAKMAQDEPSHLQCVAL